MGWGGVFDKLLGFVPGRKESLLNKLDRLELERDELSDKFGVPTVRDHDRMQYLLSEIKRLRERLKNIE